MKFNFISCTCVFGSYTVCICTEKLYYLLDYLIWVCFGVDTRRDTQGVTLTLYVETYWRLSMQKIYDISFIPLHVLLAITELKKLVLHKVCTVDIWSILIFPSFFFKHGKLFYEKAVLSKILLRIICCFIICIKKEREWEISYIIKLYIYSFF